MKIINYIFLLFLLALVAATVHVSTQKNEFDLRESYFIHAPKTQVYSFLNDCRNWQTYSYWKQTDPSQTFTFPANTIGAGGYCEWEGSDESGKLITTKSLANQKSYKNYASMTTEPVSVGRLKTAWKAPYLFGITRALLTLKPK